MIATVLNSSAAIFMRWRNRLEKRVMPTRMAITAMMPPLMYARYVSTRTSHAKRDLATAGSESVERQVQYL